MKKIIITTIISVAVTILLLSAVGKSQTQVVQPAKTKPTITTEAVTTLEAKEKMTTTPVITKPATSITTTSPTLTTTATTTTSTTTIEVTNTTPPTTIEQTEKTTTTTQPPLKVVTTETTPANGTVKDDKIYVCGFTATYIRRRNMKNKNISTSQTRKIPNLWDIFRRCRKQTANI